MCHNRREAGLTLVELMIVVALIGVLSAVAIPNFMVYQARSRRSEAFANLAGIARVQKSYFATKSEYHDSAGPWPNYVAYGGLGAHKMDWDAASEAAWGGLGWAPEGDVYYSYQSNTCLSDCPDGMCFTASAYGDVDDDGFPSAVMYVEPKRQGGTTVECPSGLGGKLNFGTPTGPSGPIYSEVAVQRSTDEY